MPWYVLRSKPLCEAMAIREMDRYCDLRSQPRHETYLPRFFDNARRRKQVLFASYLFLKASDVYHFIFKIPSIIYMLSKGDSPDGTFLPATIDDGFVDGLKRREDHRGLVMLDVPPPFNKGDKVRMLSGPLKGYLGIYDGMDAKERCTILLGALGGSKTQLPLQAIEAA